MKRKFNQLTVNQMKHTLILFSFCVLFIGCTKDWGNPTIKNYPINESFTGLTVSNAFEVTVSDQVTDVVVTVGESAHKRVIVQIINGELHIGFKTGTRYNGMAKAIIPATANLRNLDLSGASSFLGDLNGHDVNIDLSGASFFKGNVDADELDINLSGSSDAIITGFCQDKMEINLSGGSSLNASLLETQSVYGEISGASDANVTVCSHLNVNLSGASTLTYGTINDDCNPIVNCNTSGGSTVSRRW